MNIYQKIKDSRKHTYVWLIVFCVLASPFAFNLYQIIKIKAISTSIVYSTHHFLSPLLSEKIAGYLLVVIITIVSSLVLVTPLALITRCNSFTVGALFAIITSLQIPIIHAVSKYAAFYKYTLGDFISAIIFVLISGLITKYAHRILPL